MITVLSIETDAKYVSLGAQETSKMSPSWPRNVDRQRHHSTFTTFDPNTEPPVNKKRRIRARLKKA